ncbi:MAG TPA: hypothetical protein PKE30_07425 [Niabella sp.]|nr:hypothetical protein [Niabella sp.]
MYLKQLIGFFIRASRDHRIGPHHVALYVAIFQQWCIQNGKSPVSVTQSRLREVAKIGRTTYYKCINELEAYGYIKYVRSYSPVLGSIVYLVELDRK